MVLRYLMISRYASNNNASQVVKRKGEDSLINKGKSGYYTLERLLTSLAPNNYVWEAGAGINYTTDDVEAELYKVMSLLEVYTKQWTTLTGLPCNLTMSWESVFLEVLTYLRELTL